MSKPKTRDEAFLRRKFKNEDDIPYENEREVRENKRIWKREKVKKQRQADKRDTMRRIEREDEGSI